MSTSFVELVEKYRQEIGWDRTRLAQELGVHQTTISRALDLQDPERLPSVDLARRLISTLESKLSLTWADLSELAEAYLLTPEQRDEKASSHPTLVGIILPSLETSSYWGQLVSAIEKQAVTRDSNLVFTQHNNQFERFATDLASFQDISSIEGIICIPPYGQGPITSTNIKHIQSLINAIHDRGVPVVFIERYPIGKLRDPYAFHLGDSAKIKRVPYVGPSRRRMVEISVNHLRHLGHTRIGALIDLPWVSAEAEILSAFKRTLGPTHNPKLIRTGSLRLTGDNERTTDPRHGIQNAWDLLSLPEDQRPTAILCSTHLLARAALVAAEKCQIDVPRDLSIISVDPADYPDGMTPRITRVGYNVSAFAQLALDYLLQLIGDKDWASGVVRDDAPDFPKPVLFDGARLIRPDLVQAPFDKAL